MNDLTTAFAENVKRHRKVAGLTQKALGAMLGYTEKAVSKWESGHTIPPAEALVALAEAMQVSVDTLLDTGREPSYFLGIDGGGTKTLFALADRDGRVIRTRCLGPCNPVNLGFDNAAAVLATGIRDICRGIPCSHIALFAGIAAAEVGNNRALFEEFFKSFRFARFVCDNDIVNILAAGLGEQDGIAVIMGTGTNAFAQIRGTLYQKGGFGTLFDYGGNGYALGRDAVRAALLDECSAGAHTAITTLLQARLGARVSDCLAEFYEQDSRFLASLAPVVFEAHDAGDAVAHTILKHSTAEVARLIGALLSHFPPAAQPVKVVCVGGLTKRADILFPLIRTQLPDKHAVALSVYPHEPVLGALKKAGAPIDTTNDNGITRQTIG